LNTHATEPFRRDVVVAEPLCDGVPIVSKPLKQLYEYWASLKGGGDWPLRSNIEPEDIRHALSFVILARWDTSKDDFYFLICGNVVDRVHGMSGSRKYFSEIWQDETLSVVRAEYQLALSEARPYLHHIRKIDAAKEDASFERILLPISFSGDHVDGLFGGLETFEPYWAKRLYDARQ